MEWNGLDCWWIIGKVKICYGMDWLDCSSTMTMKLALMFFLCRIPIILDVLEYSNSEVKEFILGMALAIDWTNSNWLVCVTKSMIVYFHSISLAHKYKF